jgi:2-polyprenyl-3-methyl-5-hydroxy-6-metoxy-1,4-benzoquinol methylase
MTQQNQIKHITTKDFSVSGESFDLYLDEEFQFLKTTPKPSLEKLPSYYHSEDYISHTDSNKTLLEKIYQIARKYALGKKRRLIEKHFSKKSLLDIGCGTGDFLLEMKNHGWQVTGYEPESKAKQIAVQKGVGVTEDLNQLPEQSFDVITLWHVLEHVPNLQEQLQQLKRLLKPKGLIIIAVPNFKSFDAHYYQEFWAAYDVPRHLWHFSKNSIRLLFAKNNFKVVQILPMYLDSFYVSLLSEKYKTGKTNFIKAFAVGLYANLKGMQTQEFSSQIYLIKNQN